MSENTNNTAEPVAILIADPMLLPALKSPIVDWKIDVMSLPINTKLFTAPPSQSLTPAETFQLHEIFASIEECPPILETDSFIVKRVKDMAHMINSQSCAVREAYERAAKLLESKAANIAEGHGVVDYSTNALEFSSSVAEDAYNSYMEDAEEIRALIEPAEKKG